MRPPAPVTIGFDSIAALSSGRVVAATAFWNAEGVALRRAGVPTREFRVDDYGAPSYPELVLVTTRAELDSRREELAATVDGIRSGYMTAIERPEEALDDLVAAVPGLERDDQAAQLDALEGAFGNPMRLNREVLREWAEWDAAYGIVDEPPDVDRAFDLTLLGP